MTSEELSDLLKFIINRKIKQKKESGYFSCQRCGKDYLFRPILTTLSISKATNIFCEECVSRPKRILLTEPEDFPDTTPPTTRNINRQKHRKN